MSMRQGVDRGAWRLGGVGMGSRGGEDGTRFMREYRERAHGRGEAGKEE